MKTPSLGGDFMGDPALVENLVYGSPIILDLLLDNGLQVRPVVCPASAATPASAPTPPSIRPARHRRRPEEDGR
ncbi:MAG: hypothetical protein ACOX20_01475 [Limnochordia bacterium]